MIHKSSLTGIAAVTALVVQCASASDFVDVAPVVASTPILEQVNTPQQQCSNEQVVTPAPSNSGSPLGAIVGGIAGGVLGHQIGSGRGNAVATGIGAVTGAVIGDKVDPNGGVFGGNANAGANQQVVQRCHTVDNWQDVIRGYNVLIATTDATSPSVCRTTRARKCACRSVWSRIGVRRCPTTDRNTTRRPIIHRTHHRVPRRTETDASRLQPNGRRDRAAVFIGGARLPPPAPTTPR